MSATLRFEVAKTFSVQAKPGLDVEGYADPTNPYIPRKTEYVFRKDGLRDVLAFLRDAQGDGMFLTGPTGAGKTSLVCQVAARLNWPVQAVTCHSRMELRDMVGHHVLADGETKFIHGPLSVAARDGHILLLNETDIMDPAELAGLNDIIEGQPLVIPENGGEVIPPHAKFRVFATGNSAGAGDQTGLYQGVLRQNLAFMDRFRIIRVDYPEPDVEEQMIAAVVPSMSRELIGKMIQVANDVRRLFTADPSEGGTQLTLTMSTRVVARWAQLSVTFKGAPKVLEYALEQSLTARADPQERAAIHEIARAAFGDDLWNPQSQQAAP
jgi:cobaltochelatase CobS